MSKKHTAAILLAGVFWGLMGVFVRNLARLGFDSPGVLIVRIGIAAVLFAVMLLIADRKLFKIKLRDLWCFLGSGLCSILFFTFCYFQTISLSSLSTAAILLYTAPAMVMVMSTFFFKEKLTKVKLLALLVSFLGCYLVSGADGSGAGAPGIIYGLCSALGYALYSIFARFALNRGYDSRTINFYSMLISCVGGCIIWGGVEPVRLMFSSGESLVWCLLTGVFSCFVPYFLYTYGLTGVETSRASIMASLEPVVAAIAGWLVFRESMSIAGLFGFVLVLAAIVLLNMDFKRKKEAS